MAAPDPHQPTEDDLLARRLSDFFATVNGPPARNVPAAPPAPAAASASGSKRPEPRKVEVAGGTDAPSVDMVRLVKYLDAQLELTRKEAREGLHQVLDAVTALAGRVTALETRQADFREELFDWLEGYTGWERTELARMMDRVTEARDVLIPAAIQDPQAPTPPRHSRFGSA